MNIRNLTAPNAGPLTLSGTQTYLIGETAVLDPGPDIGSHVEAILAALPKLDTILITHRHADHAPAAVPLKRATGARIIAPRNVLQEVDRRVFGGEVLTIEDEQIEVIATPGHTNEHVCYLTSAGDLFTGDTVLGEGTTAIFPPDGHMGDYLRSLELLRARKPKRILPAHGPVREDAVAWIEHYIAHRLERERQVLEAVANGADTIAQVRARVYPELDARLHGAAEVQVRAHLVKLVEEGRVAAALLA